MAIYRSIKGSDKTLLKVIIILMAGAILSATWILLPVMLVLILIFVPKQVKKFTAIKEGIEEVKSGNLSYKIPVEEDAKGIKGEFDRMAEGINDISQASNIAVQNELKNQRMKIHILNFNSKVPGRHHTGLGLFLALQSCGEFCILNTKVLFK